VLVTAAAGGNSPFRSWPSLSAYSLPAAIGRLSRTIYTAARRGVAPRTTIRPPSEGPARQ
jgi:hypothetical protein